jgi:hypothetical protein
LKKFLEKYKFTPISRRRKEDVQKMLKVKLILLIIMILEAAIISVAQESKTDKPFQQKKFNTEAITDTTEYFVISTKIKTDTLENKILPFQKLPGDSFTQNNQSINEFFCKSTEI